jgi:hypothetical protein
MDTAGSNTPEDTSDDEHVEEGEEEEEEKKDESDESDEESDGEKAKGGAGGAESAISASKKVGHAGTTGKAFKWGVPGNALTLALVKSAYAHQCHTKTKLTMDVKFSQVVTSLYASRLFKDMPPPELNPRQCSAKFARLVSDWAKTKGFGDDGTHVNVSKLDSECLSEWDRFMLDLFQCKNLIIKKRKRDKLKDKQKTSAIMGIELMIPAQWGFCNG